MTPDEILSKYDGIEHLFIPKRAELEILFQAEQLTYNPRETREQNWDRYLAYRQVFAPIVCPWELPEAAYRGSGRIEEVAA